MVCTCFAESHDTEDDIDSGFKDEDMVICFSTD